MDDSINSGTPLELVITSFGYKKSPPPSANIVFDVRFLQNPYWVEELRPLSGRDQLVQDYVLKQELAQDFLAFLTTMLKKILPHMAERKIERYTVALGCTGGQHRSATLVEALARDLARIFPDYTVSILHRELGNKKLPVVFTEQTVAAAGDNGDGGDDGDGSTKFARYIEGTAPTSFKGRQG